MFGTSEKHSRLTASRIVSPKKHIIVIVYIPENYNETTRKKCWKKRFVGPDWRRCLQGPAWSCASFRRMPPRLIHTLSQRWVAMGSRCVNHKNGPSTVPSALNFSPCQHKQKKCRKYKNMCIYIYIHIYIYKSNSNSANFYFLFYLLGQFRKSIVGSRLTNFHSPPPCATAWDQSRLLWGHLSKTLVPKGVALCFEFHTEDEVCSIDSFKTACIVFSCFFLGKMMDWFEVSPQFWDKPLYLLLVRGGPIHLLINQPMGRGHPVSQRRNSAANIRSNPKPLPSIPWGSKGYPGDVAEHWRHVESR
jgi:hypothetical protein